MRKHAKAGNESEEDIGQEEPEACEKEPYDVEDCAHVGLPHSVDQHSLVV